MESPREETPGEVVLRDGRSYKSYRGMGSVAAMKEGSHDRYFQDLKNKKNIAERLLNEALSRQSSGEEAPSAQLDQLLKALAADENFMVED